MLLRDVIRNAGRGAWRKSDAAAAIAQQPGENLRTKLSDWLHRYGLAECAGLTCALLASFAVRRVTGSGIAAAYGGAWGESLGYSGVIILRDYRAAARTALAAGRSVGVRDAGGVA